MIQQKTTDQIIAEQKAAGKFISLTLDKLKEYTDQFNHAAEPDKRLDIFNMIFINGVVLQIRRN